MVKTEGEMLLELKSDRVLPAMLYYQKKIAYLINKNEN